MTTRSETVEHVLALMDKHDWEGAAEAFHDDVVIEWPQSRERLRGKQACLEIFSGYPGGTPRLGKPVLHEAGDMVLAEIDAVYPDGGHWRIVSLFEFRGEKVAKETDWFAQEFEPPDWRAHLVESMRA